MIFIQLFSVFFKIGLFTLGGGYAMLALIQQEIVRYGWMTTQEFVDVVGIAEMTPGPIAVNAATFVGFRSAGVPGALLATLAVVLPSLISVTIVSNFWETRKNSKRAQQLFAGIRPVVVGLVGATTVLLGSATYQVLSFGRPLFWTVGLAILSFVGVSFKGWDPITVLIASAIIGLLVFR